MKNLLNMRDTKRQHPKKGCQASSRFRKTKLGVEKSISKKNNQTKHRGTIEPECIIYPMQNLVLAVLMY